MSILQLITVFFCALAFGQLTAHFAFKRGRNPKIWFMLGALFGILGILLVFILPSKKIITKKRALPPPPLKSDSWLKMWYFLDATRQQRGPLEFPDFIKAWKQKEFLSSSYIWSEGMEKWKKVEELPELIHEIDQSK